MDSKTNSCLLLLDVGGTFVKAGMATGDGRLVPEAEFSQSIRSDGTREEITESLCAIVRRGAALAVERQLRLAGIGVAIPGPFDYAAGVSHMQHKFQQINGLSLRDLLQALPEIGPGVPIYFVQDVNAALMGELTHGNAVGAGNATLVSLGTGLGYAFSRDGEVQCSAAGGPAVVIYNRPFRDGILEDYASKRGFLRVYEQVTGRPAASSLTVADLGRMACEGDAEALETFACVGRILAGALGELLREQRIECLLFGGQISRSFAYMEPALREGLKELTGLCRIAPVKHIGEAAFYGLLNRMSRQI